MSESTENRMSSSAQESSWLSDSDVDVDTDEEVLSGITDAGDLEDEVFLPDEYDADDEAYATAIIIPAPPQRKPIPQNEWAAEWAARQQQQSPSNYDRIQDSAGT